MKKIIFIIIVFIISIFVYINVNAEIVIPNNAIRIRVLANSNNVIDQNIKKEVSNYVSKYMYVKLKDVKDVGEANTIINDSISDLNDKIKDIFNKNNYDMNYSINFGDNYFPDKSYKGILYKKGNYKSLVISIGNAEGDNWWCVLFPPLCLLEADELDTGEVEYKTIISEMIEKYFKH